MFTKREIQKLSEIAALPKLTDKNVLFTLLSKEERQEIIKTSLIEEERFIAAAIEIQKVWRGYRTRALLFSILQPISNRGSSYLSSHYTSSPTFSDIRASLNPSRLSDRVRSSLSRELSKIEISYQRYTEEALPRMDHETLLTFQEFCAFTIQSWWKDLMHRFDLYQHLAPTPELPKSDIVLTRFEAACIIQRVWRKHIDLQVFKYYKDLINFRQQGDPRVMLKCTNPKECELLDQASGVHVRFRLGGVRFPPTIYYKIFSHINVTDVCSFAPRDYTKEKELPPQLVHHKDMKGFGVEQDVDTTDWYKRVENNGWRPVCDRVLKCSNQDPIAHESGQKKIDYKHCKIQRKKDVEVRKKNKKIEWMKKMYAVGMLQANDTEDEEVRELVDTAARGVFSTVQENGISTIEDWEVDELIQWTQGLNFERYHEDWKDFGTTQIDNLKKETVTKKPW